MVDMTYGLWCPPCGRCSAYSSATRTMAIPARLTIHMWPTVGLYRRAMVGDRCTRVAMSSTGVAVYGPLRRCWYSYWDCSILLAMICVVVYRVLDDKIFMFSRPVSIATHLPMLLSHHTPSRRTVDDRSIVVHG